MLLEPPMRAWLLLGVCTVLVSGFLLYAYRSDLKLKVPLFYCWIGAIAVWGGILAFLLPIALDSGFGKDDDGRVLRQLILYTTGGVLGVITLGETHRKNNQEKEKNENDHIRQVHAERRSRYTTAVEQLASEKAAVRLGGIYTLVGLVDEWLTDDNLDKDKQKEEGQVIINNLCSYIRTPFLVAEKLDAYEARKDLNMLEELEAVLSPEEGSPQLQALHKRVIDSNKYKEPEDIAAAYAEHREEQDVRRAIFAEISKRIKVSQDKVSVISSVWSDFDFDFSRALIFYPLNNLTLGKAIFSSARFYGEADFRDTEFTKDADFRDAKFTGNADFWGAEFTGNADFWGAEFTSNAHFTDAKFTSNAHFTDAKFTSNAHFRKAEFTGNAHFRKAEFTGNAQFTDAKFTGNAQFGVTKFTGNADFWGAEFTGNADFWGAEFTGNADFWGAEFTGNAHFTEAEFTGNAQFKDAKFTGNAQFGVTKFTRNANFWGAEFTSNAHFTDAKFTGNAHFWGAEFTGNADFWGAEFTGNANFWDAEFTGNAHFRKAEFTGNVSFNSAYFEQYAPTFADDIGSARFSDRVNWTDSNFSVHAGSQPIELGSATLGDKTFRIPLGAVVFNPSSGETSESAKPLENSDSGEENKSE